MPNSSLMFAMLLTILTKGKVTKRYLAEKYEISERTVCRYVEAIIATGVPLYSVRGKNGGYAISSEFQFDKSFFSPAEIERVVTCLRAAGKGDGLNECIIDKLRYMGVRKNSEKYLLETQSLIIDAGPWADPAQYRAKMETLQRAIDNHKSLSMMYVDRYEERTHRLFDPYFRILKDGVWYTYGWCHYRKDFRLFKLARIKSMIETEEPFTRRDCDVYSKLDGMFDDSGEEVAFEIEFSSTILGEIEEWLGMSAVMERGYKYIAKATLPAGRMLTEKLLGFGSGVKVLSPASLRDEVIAECRRILRNAGL